MDGQWHKRAELVLAFLEHLPPERLVRYKGDGRAPPNLSLELRVKRGASGMVSQTANHLLNTGQLEKRGSGKGPFSRTEYRLVRTPEQVAIDAAAARVVAQVQRRP
jgi:hypothetical protein